MKLAEADRDAAIARHREAMRFTAEVLRERDAAIDAAHACAESLREAHDFIRELMTRQV